MIEIIPAILATDKKEFLEKLRRIPRSVARAHIDVMDGTLTTEKSFADPKLLRKFPRLNFEIHLMVDRPLATIPLWAKAERILFHLESKDDPVLVASAIREHRTEAVAAIHPKTPVQKIFPLLKILDGVTVMGVTPGAQGRTFQKNALRKIAELKKTYPGLPVEIDGGIRPETAPLAAAAGADRLVSGSYLFHSPSFEEALEHLKNSLS